MHSRLGLTILLPLLLTTISMGCTHYIELNPEEVEALATYESETFVVVHDGSRDVEVTAENQPTLRLELDVSCSTLRRLFERCDDEAEGPLDEASFETDHIIVNAGGSRFSRSQYDAWTVEYDSIREARLYLRDYRPQDWHPRMGFGVIVGGPSLSAAAYGQLFPHESMAVEAGVGGVPTPEGYGGGYVGLRLRPFAIGFIHPFLGTWINYWEWFSGDDDQPNQEIHRVVNSGLRAGIDLHLLHSQRLLMTLEANLLHPIVSEKDDFHIDLSRQWAPWGGVSFALLY